MPQRESGSSKKGTPKQPQEEAGSAGQRSSAGSNYGDWRPDPKERTTGGDEPNRATDSNAGQAGSVSGTAPSTAPSGIGSKPHK